jgi:hypothetical protein
MGKKCIQIYAGMKETTFEARFGVGGIILK